MAPEVLIVGDASRRADLVARVQKLGYAVSVCSAADLSQRVAERNVPSAVVVCTEDEDPRPLMADLRGTRLGAGIPVTLHGPLGGRIGDLVDVLDLGADHFLEEPADDEQLANAIADLAGPGESPTPEEPEPSESAPEPESEPSAPVDDGSTDVVLGQLHRTLDKLEERLRDSDGDADDLDLAELGFAELPDTGESAPSTERSRGSSIELSLPRDPITPMTPAPPPPSRGSSGRREPTERLGRAGSRPEATKPPAPAEVETPEDRPRRRSPLPIDDRGSLDEVEVPRLLWTLHRAGYTGQLCIEQGRVQKRLWWREGDIVFVRSNVGHDRLVDGLMRRGLLTREQYDAARSLAAKEPGRVGPLLVESGFLKAAEMPRVLRNHLIRIIDSTFPWAEGQWVLTPDERVEESPLVDTPVALIVAEGIRHRMESTQLAALLGGLDQYPRFRVEAVVGGPRALAERLMLTPSEEAWLSRLDGSQRLRELLEAPQTDELELLGLTYGLHVLEHLELFEEGTADADVEPGSVDRVRVRDRLRIAREGDYFAMLGLPRDASRLDVRRAHAQLQQTFAKEHLEADTVAAMARELEELRDLLQEARDVLMDEGLRSAYLAHLEDA